MAEKIQLTKKDRLSVAWRHQFLQGSWNYERMQNGGWCYSIIPAIKKLYKDPQDRVHFYQHIFLRPDCLQCCKAAGK